MGIRTDTRLHPLLNTKYIHTSPGERFTQTKFPNQLHFLINEFDLHFVDFIANKFLWSTQCFFNILILYLTVCRIRTKKKNTYAIQNCTWRQKYKHLPKAHSEYYCVTPYCLSRRKSSFPKKNQHGFRKTEMYLMILFPK